MEKDDGRAVSNFVMQALSNQPLTIYGTGTQTRSFCYISDMIKAFELLATVKNISGEVINLGNPHEITVLELAHLIKDLTQSKSTIAYQPAEGDDPKKRKPDITKAKKLLGWSPEIDLNEGLQKTIAFFKETYV